MPLPLGPLVQLLEQGGMTPHRPHGILVHAEGDTMRPPCRPFPPRDPHPHRCRQSGDGCACAGNARPRGTSSVWARSPMTSAAGSRRAGSPSSGRDPSTESSNLSPSSSDGDRRRSCHRRRPDRPPKQNPRPPPSPPSPLACVPDLFLVRSSANVILATHPSTLFPEVARHALHGIPLQR
jgi:hypothetical protein